MMLSRAQQFLRLGGKPRTPLEAQVLAMFAGNKPGLLTPPMLDYSGLYEENTGGTPVAALEKTAGLVLDIRLGLPLGPELLPNLDFTSGWTAQGSATPLTATTFSVTGTAGEGMSQSGVLVVGTWYEISFNYTKPANAELRFTNSLSSSATITTASGSATSGTSRGIFNATSANIFFRASAVSGTFGITNVKLRTLAGNHLSMVTATARPKLVPAFNRLTSGLLPASGTGYTTATVAATAPFVGGTVQRITKTDATTPRYTQNTSQMNVAANTAYRAARWFKYDGFDTTTSIEFNNLNNWDKSWIAQFAVASTGVTVSSQTQCTATVTPYPDGWYLAVVNFTSGAAPSSPSNPSVLYRITGASGATLLTCNADLRLASEGSSSYPMAIDNDGVDDGLETAGATSFASDMDFFAAVRKDSTAQGLIAWDSSTEFFATAAPSTSTSYLGCGTPTTYVNGVAIGNTRQDLLNALPLGEWKILEVRNLNLSTWALLKIGNYTSYVWNGAIQRMALLPAQSESNRALVRRLLGQGVGLSL